MAIRPLQREAEFGPGCRHRAGGPGPAPL